MSANRPRPPRLAEALVERCIRNPKAREGAIGDLREEFEGRCRTRGRPTAVAWYWLAALRLSGSYARERRRRRRAASTSLSGTPPRGGSFMQATRQDLSFALRTLSSSYGITTVAVVTLALGIGATTAMFSTLNAAFFRPLPYADADRLVMGRATFDGGVNPVMSAYDFYDYREQADLLESFSAFTGFTLAFTITGFDEAERVDGIYVSWDLFRTLGVGPQSGRHLSEAESEPGGPPVVVISSRFARRHFGSAAAAVGQTLRVEGTPLAIVGVMPAGFHFVHDVDLWLPMRRDGPYAGARRFHNWLAVGRLADGATLQQAQAEVDAISARLEAEYPDSNEGKALLLTDLHATLVEAERTSLVLLMVAVGLVLLIACANVANLLLARGSARRSELAVRAAVGASRGRLVRQLLTESAVLALVAGGAGIVVAVWLQQLVLELLPLRYLGIETIGIDAPMLLFAILTAVVTSLLFGTIPAIQGVPRDVARSLEASGRTTAAGRGVSLRGMLVVGQVTLSVILLIGSGLMIRSLAGLLGTPLGFATDDLVTAEFRLNESDYPEVEQVRVFYDNLLAEVRALPGVSAAAMISQLPIRDPGNNVYVYDASKPPVATREATLAYTRNVLPGYFEAMGIPLIAGRVIEPADDASSTPVMVIDETMAAELFPEGNPIGRRLVIDWGERVTAAVIGVVGAVRVNALRVDPGATMYFSFLQVTSRTMRLAVRTAGNPGSVTGPLRALVGRLDPNLPIAGMSTMESLIGESMAGDRIIAGSLSLFAAVALLLAVVGLYSVLAYYVAQRRREIGLRVAIGAPHGRILSWIVGRGMTLASIGLLLGVVGSVLATRLIESLLFGVGSTDPLTFLGVCGLFAAVALLACLLPAWRAIRVDPLVAFRG